jgi:ATP-binding cassette subfamily F protein 3
MLFRLDQVHKSYGSNVVLRGATFQINPGERVGLVGRNGAGKTTIFRLISKTEEPDSGQVVLLKNIRVGVLEQQPQFGDAFSVHQEAMSVFTTFNQMESEMARLEHLMGEETGEELDQTMHVYSDLRHRYELTGGFSYSARADGVLAGLGFPRDGLSQPANELSGGQKARLALAKLLLTEPDILLLDEPTNHLDVTAVEWLEDFLSDYKAAYVIISHDRFLLDRTTKKIVEVDDGRCTSYTGNYSAYVRQREERRLVQLREYNQQQEIIATTEEFIRRNIAGQKTKQAKSRRNKLERLERIEAVRDNQAADFGLRNVARTGDIVLSVSDLNVGYGYTVIGKGISFILKRGERLGVIGANGTGKTTFLKTILGKIRAIGGEATWGSNVEVGYFDQELAVLDRDSTPIEEIAKEGRETSQGELRSYLAKFLFQGDDPFKPVTALSGGEQSRLALAKLIYSRVNVLVLDEPTNHLDIASREALERALGEYTGTIVAVSHDRYFLDKIATQILHFNLGSVSHYNGSYSDYYSLQHVAQAPPKEEATKQRAKQEPIKRQDKGEKPRRRSAEDIEREIDQLDSELAELNRNLADPPTNWLPEDYSRLNSRHIQITSQLEALFKEWEAAPGSQK